MLRHEYQCDRCNTIGSYTTAIGYYRLVDGANVTYVHQAAWCYSGKALRSAERLPNVELLAENLADLEENGWSDDDRESNWWHCSQTTYRILNAEGMRWTD